ncbi:MAG: hypothetical protein M3Q91_18840 [Acidobacteriota bacterium]|nr:hypothetical protein [Acidobacteriota bacterium]
MSAQSARTCMLGCWQQWSNLALSSADCVAIFYVSIEQYINARQWQFAVVLVI